MYGQLKDTYPKWEGFKKNYEYLIQLNSFIKSIQEEQKEQINKEKLIKDLKSTNEENNHKNNYNYNGYFTKDFIDSMIAVILDKGYDEKAEEFINEVNNITLPITSRFGKIVDSVYILQNLKLGKKFSDLKGEFQILEEKFSKFKTDFLAEFYYFAKVAKGCGKILTMIYFCLLLISATFAGVSMMFYACLKRQGYLQLFMHVLWNIIRFFMFSFFFYGSAYGMCYLALRDAVAYVMFIFGEENLSLDLPYLIPKEGKKYLYYCLINSDSDYKKQIDDTLAEALNDFFKNYQELVIITKDYPKNSISYSSNIPTTVEKPKLDKIVEEQNNMMNNIILKFFKEDNNENLCKILKCASFPEMAIRDGGLFGSFNCTFLKSDLNMMYKTLFDLSIEARILCALSCCISFFGAIFVYFFLLTLHHYDTELFFDNGKGIFNGFEGIGNTQKKNSNDPSKKKRKLRAEIELSSRNEEYSAYQPDNKED